MDGPPAVERTSPFTTLADPASTVYTRGMEFVERRQGGLYLTGSRISLATIIHAFRNGDSPETLRDEERIWQEIDQKAEAINSPLQQRLRAGRSALQQT